MNKKRLHQKALEDKKAEPPRVNGSPAVSEPRQLSTESGKTRDFPSQSRDWFGPVIELSLSMKSLLSIFKDPFLETAAFALEPEA
jgi:hypothetical protein